MCTFTAPSPAPPCPCDNLDKPGTLANRSARLFRPPVVVFRFRACRLRWLIMLSKLRMLRVSCPSSSSYSSSSSSSSSTSSSSEADCSSGRTERLDPGRDGTSTICCPDSS